MTQQMIDTLIAKGGKRWQKNGMDRIYFNASDLGLECTRYNTGNISSATFNGERISNSWARELSAAVTYVNVITGAIGFSDKTLLAAVEKMMSEIQPA
jgi:hypothetical protein